MDTDNSAENSESTETSNLGGTAQDIAHDNEAEFVLNRSSVITIRGEKDGYWAEIRMSYRWDVLGTKFTVNTIDYRARSNGRHKGDVHLLLNSEGGTGWNQLLKDGAIQNESWHALDKELSVSGNARWADVHFSFIYDRDNVSDVDCKGMRRINFELAPPLITIPANNSYVPLSPMIYGTGLEEAQVKVYRAGIGTELSPWVRVDKDGTWKTNLNSPLPDMEKFVFTARQTLGDAQSPWATDVEVNIVLKPSIDNPGRPILASTAITGRGIPSAKVQLHRSHSDDAISQPVQVNSDGRWTVSPTLPSGEIQLTAHQTIQGVQSEWAENVTFTVLHALTINVPPAAQPMQFTVTGTNGIVGATVDVRIDPTSTVVGSGTVIAGGGWSALVQLEPGAINLTAVQHFGGVTSLPGTARLFKIKPPTLADIGVQYPNAGTVRFSGSGYSDATVDIHIANNGTPQISEPVSGGTWSVDWPDRHPQTINMNARQRIGDGAGGWIPSDWDDGFTITIPVPAPTLAAREGTDRKPEFSGAGNEWAGQPPATIKVQRNNNPAPGVPDATVSGGRWSQTSTEAWVPGTYNVRAQQVFEGIASEWTSSISLVIKAPLPTVTVSTDGLTPRFSGTCLNTAQVNLGFPEDAGLPHYANVSTTNWTFTRAGAFEPGRHRVRVTQTIGGQTSNEASLDFDVPVLRPVITSPISGEDVDHNPVITGTGGVSGAVMRVFDVLTDLLLGEVEVVGDRWSLDLKDRPFGPHAVYAIQRYETLVSVESEAAAFKVILFPPSIDNPKPGEPIERTFQFNGCARPLLNGQLARVELWLKEATEAFADVRVRYDGFWWHNAELPLGDDTVRAKQFFDGHESLFTAEQSYTVVPSKPLIESPALGQEVGARLTISGHGYPGDQVEVAWEDNPEDVLDATPVQANGTWSLALRIDKPAGPQSLIVRQECAGYRSDWSTPHGVQSLSNAPVFTAPQAGRWFIRPPRFEGTGDNGNSIELSYWFDPWRVVAPGGVVAGGAWAASPDVPWAPGPHWMKARHGGTGRSEWGDSERFEWEPTPSNPDAAR